MTQNIYDNPDFFAGYGRLERSLRGLDGAAEWPALRAMVGDVRGLNIVDLGCGYGWFCRWAREHGAHRVVGIDVSARMLEQARARTSDAGIEYQQADLDQLELPTDTFDLAYSSLALHYIVDLARLLGTVHEALRPGGRFVFSVEHPIFSAPQDQSWLSDSAGRRTWPVNGYLEEGPRTTSWIADGVIKQHRSVGSYVNALLEQGFSLCRLEDWGPSEAQVAQRPEWACERDRPPFLLVAARL
jgi:SAM-dependent methyltransferase